MTKEEAKEFIVQSVKSNIDIALVADAIEALSQEPCDDAISRQAVLNTEYQVKIINDIEYVMLSEVQMKIRKMSPVTQKPIEYDAISREATLEPYEGLNDNDTISVWLIRKNIEQQSSVTQKLGKWIITPMSNIAYCSECDYLFKDVPAIIVEHFKHCPYCGATMESEEV